jgi:Asp-tRNA(Asn)/Glu-tRNA(Gln) amidotransferase B subunit
MWMKKVLLWHGMLEVLIKHDDLKDKTEKTNERTKIQTNHVSSAADELKKLVELFKEGALSKKEFKQLKAQLLKNEKNS